MMTDLCIWGAILSRMKPCCECHGYFRTAHVHVSGWSVVSSHRGLASEMIFVVFDIFLRRYLRG